MKNKERNLNRFIGNILISSFEKAISELDIKNRDNCYLINKKEFQEYSFNFFNEELEEKYYKLKNIDKKNMFETIKPDTENILDIKKIVYNELKNLNVNTDENNNLDRKELEMYIYNYKKKNELTLEEKKELFNSFKEQMKNINMDILKTITIYDSFYDKVNDIKPLNFTEKNEEKISNQKANLFVLCAEDIATKLSTITNTLNNEDKKEILEKNKIDITNKNSEEMLKDSIYKEYFSYINPIMKNIKSFEHDINKNLKDEIVSYVSDILKISNEHENTLYKDIKEFYLSILVETKNEDEINYINHISKAERKIQKDTILEKNAKEFNLELENLIPILSKYKEEFENNNFRRNVADLFEVEKRAKAKDNQIANLFLKR